MAQRQVQQDITNTLDKFFQETIRSLVTSEFLLASLLEGKFKSKGIRLSASERERLRVASSVFFRTGDTSALLSAVERKREIRIRLTNRDLERLERKVTKVIEDGTVAATSKLARTKARDAFKWADDEVDWTESIRQGFEERLAKTWRHPLRHYARFQRMAAYIGQLAVSHFKDENVLESSRLANALLMLHTRACAVAGEVEALIRAGYADGAAARWRTLHEIAVTGAFLVEHGEEAAERYLAHFPCEQLKSARLYEEHRRALGEKALGARFLKSLEAQVDALKQKFGDDFRHDNGWAAHALQLRKVTFVDIERAVKLPFMRPFYRLASEQVHASSRGAVMRSGLIDQKPEQAILLAGPSNYGFADAAMNSARSLLMSTASLVQVAPTVDMNVYSMILAKWSGALMESFVKAQQGIERREERLSGRPRTMRNQSFPASPVVRARRGPR